MEDNVDSNIDKRTNYINQRFEWLQPLNSNNEQNTSEENFVKEQLFHGEVWGLVRTTTSKCLLHQDLKFAQIIKAYLDNIREKELVHNHDSEAGDAEDGDSENSNSEDGSSEDVDLEDGNSDKENILILKNPYIAATKGRPNSSSYKNNKKNNKLVKKSLNNRKRKRGPNHCIYCKMAGHNIATCSKKANN
ncbi:22992_t:CDS:1 [Gigaspora rosea]|nr:22992_t:CDS:1 [Gigaspora rosea]